MTIKDWIKITYEHSKNELSSFSFRPRVVCNDGFSLSIQGHSGSYSEPRNNSDYYESMEVGFPTDFDDPEFKDNDGQVIGYVPVSYLENVIKRHGGINIKKSELLTMNGVNKFLRDKKLERVINK